jgi:hypothetical protein
VITERENIIYSSELSLPRYVEGVRLYDKIAEGVHSYKTKLKLRKTRSLSPETQHKEDEADGSYPPTTEVKCVWNCRHTHTHTHTHTQTHTHEHTQTAFLIPNKKAENMMQIDRRVWKKEHERYTYTIEET